MKKIFYCIPPISFIIGFMIGASFILINTNVITNDSVSYFHEIGHVSFWDIFPNNITMCLLFILGCGLISCIMILLQGLSFGFMFSLWIFMGNTIDKFLLLFLPHVFFEFIAMSIAGCIGFNILNFFISNKKITFKVVTNKNKYLLVCCLVSVFIAAIIECYITPYIHVFL